MCQGTNSTLLIFYRYLHAFSTFLFVFFCLLFWYQILWYSFFFSLSTSVIFCFLDIFSFFVCLLQTHFGISFYYILLCIFWFILFKHIFVSNFSLLSLFTFFLQIIPCISLELFYVAFFISFIITSTFF